MGSPRAQTWLLLSSLLLLGSAQARDRAPRGAAVQDIDALAVPAFTFDENEAFTVISQINGAEAPDYHGTAFWYQGLLGVVYAKGMLEGGVSLFDISDPYAPELVGQGNSLLQREGHSTGFLESDEGILAVLPASNGVNLWDLSNPTRPKVAKNIALPGILPSDYDFGAWWTAVQSPYIYVAGAFNGLYVIDASNMRRPELVNQIRMGDGFRCGSVFAVGNLLVQSSSEGNRTRLYDISDPINPQLIQEVEQAHSSYSTYFNGDHIYAASDRGGLEIVDISDPLNPITQSAVAQSGGGAYVLIQDEFAHLGNSKAYYKVDISDPTAQVVVQSGEMDSEKDVDVDFVSPIGNLAVLSDDHNLTQFNVGSHLMPHQLEPDTRPPEANFQSPIDGSVNIAPTSRIGFTFTDQILVESVDETTFIVQPVGTQDGVDGYYSIQEGIVNFTPAQALAEETEYEIYLPAGGIRDLSGNGLAVDHRSTFTTGLLTINPPIAEAGDSLVGAPGTNLLLDASGTTGGVGLVEYAWDPGDGSGQSTYGADPIVVHNYAAQGHYTAIVYVRDDRGQTSTDEVKVTIVNPALQATPQYSRTLTPDGQEEILWVVNPDHHSVAAIDMQKRELLGEVSVGLRPETLIYRSDETIWVANRDSATLSIIDSRAMAVIETVDLPYGSRPYGLIQSHDASTIFISLQGLGEVWALDSQSHSPIWKRSVGPDPRGLAWVDDHLFVTRFISPKTHGEVWELSALTGEILATHSLQEDPGPDTDLGGRGVPNYMGQVVPSPDGHRLFLPSLKQNTSRGEARDGLGLTFESTNRAMLSILDRQMGGEDFAARLDFDNRDQASAVGLSKLGDYLFVALQGSQDVLIVDAFSGQEVAVLENVGEAPQGLFISQRGELFVQNFMGRSIRVYDINTFGDPDTLIPLASVKSTRSHALTPESQLGKRLFYNSADTRLSRDSYISCAGCHIDGASDQRVWDFTNRGEGFRRTKTLRGPGGTLHGPVHWSANFDEIHDFENDIRNGFEGTGLLSDADWQSGTTSQTLGDKKAGLSPTLDALAQYVGTLTDADPSPHRLADGQLSPAAQRGRLIFEDETVGCLECHGGPHFTDSQLTADAADFILHDVGTLLATSGQRLGGPLTGLDTPTLKGIWNQNHYLHDGRTDDLRDVLTTENPRDEHGQTSHLSAGELDDLVAYLHAIDSNSGAPILSQHWPEAGSSYARVEAIHLNFSSRPAVESLSAITLERNGASIAIERVLTLNQVKILPQSPLTPGDYRLVIGADLESVDGDRSGAQGFEFTVENQDLIPHWTVHSSLADAYEWENNLRRGGLVYGNRDIRFLRIPAAYEGLPYLKTAHDDRRNDSHALLDLKLSQNAIIYVALPRDQIRPPSWLSDFEPTGEKIITTDFSASPMAVYRGEFPAGRVFIGGPRTNGGNGNSAHYVIFFDKAP